jgi:hypothetical protein
MKLSDKQIIDYLHRSYTAVDGLWFMKVEEVYDFDTALDIDEKVWLVLPKIQARKIKSLTGLSAGLDDLYECFTTKLAIDGLVFTSEKEENGFTIRITECPWLALLRNAEREHVAGTIGSKICTAEYSTWAKEFGADIQYELQSQLCRGATCCTLRFFIQASS